MKILSIDTASSVCSVSILEDSYVLEEITTNDGLTHSENLMPMIKELFQKTHLKLSDIDLFCCDKGPRFFHWNTYWHIYY